MYIAYYDESGDDGYPKYSSSLFVLSAAYLHYLNWRETFETIHRFRQQLKADFGLPVKMEFHTKYFLLNKRPYRPLGLADDSRIFVIDLFCDLIAQLEIRIVNVVINKPNITTPRYGILDRALTYSVQRIENDLKRSDPAKRFMIITDEGRAGKMRTTTRKIQKINFIPSKLFGGESYRQEIKLLIEDPLPKSSKESYFIQVSDLLAYIVFLYATQKWGDRKFHNRLPEKISKNKVLEWMERLKGSLNTEASGTDEFGVVCYPK